jgi:LmbE family N-acetylglucosaminyl deacetylase
MSHKNTIMNILAIGAHPDDIELGCGGVLLKAVKQGHKIWMYTLTRGEASGDPSRRALEQIEAAKFIQASTLWIDIFEDTKLTCNYELIRHIESAIKHSCADIVYTHPMGDTHHDHRAVAQATLEAARFVSNILSYEFADTRDFKPHIYYDISDVIDNKIELLSIFSSQQHKHCITEMASKGLAQHRAAQSRFYPLVTSVEAFEALKLGLGADYSLLTSYNDNARRAPDYNPLPQEIFEWRREVPQENPVVKG